MPPRNRQQPGEIEEGRQDHRLMRAVEPAPNRVAESQRGQRDDVIRGNMLIDLARELGVGIHAGFAELHPALLEIWRLISGHYKAEFIAVASGSGPASIPFSEEVRAGQIFIARNVTAVASSPTIELYEGSVTTTSLRMVVSTGAGPPALNILERGPLVNLAGGNPPPSAYVEGNFVHLLGAVITNATFPNGSLIVKLPTSCFPYEEAQVSLGTSAGTSIVATVKANGEVISAAGPTNTGMGIYMSGATFRALHPTSVSEGAIRATQEVPGRWVVFGPSLIVARVAEGPAFVRLEGDLFTRESISR